MTGWLLDTNVLSLLAPARPQPQPALRAWLEQRNDALFISAITIAEIRSGMAKLRRMGAETRAGALDAWLARLLRHYGERVVSFDVDAALVAGDLDDDAKARGRHPGFADVAIAAIAVSRGLVVVTANARHFSLPGVSTLDPAEIVAGA